MTEYQDSKGKYFKTHAEAAASNTSMGTNPSITSDSLNPIKPVTLPSPIPESAADGLQESIGSTNTSIKSEGDKLREDRIAAQTEKKGDLSDTLKSIMQTNTDIANASGTIDRSAEDESRKEVDRLTSEIESEQLSNRRRIEKLQKSNPDGLFGGGLDAEVNRLNRESVSKQADLAIKQNAALRRYDTASSIAARALEMKLEPLKANLENLKFFYEANKSDFNKEDDRLYSEAVKKADNEYAKAEKLETELSNTKMLLMKNGAPQSLLTAVLKAKTLGEIQKLPGISKYLTSEADRLDMQLKRAQINKINADTVNEGKEKLTALEVKAQEKIQQKRNQLPVLKEKMDLINKVKDHSGLNSRVGPDIPFLPTRRGFAIADAFGGGQDFAASVQQLTNQDTLSELLALKAAGGTLGAISNKELDLLQKAASKINAWEKKDKDGIGLGEWDVDEARFKKELDQVLKSTELIYNDIYDEVGSGQLDDYLNTVSDTLLDPSNIYSNSGYDTN